MPVALWVAAIGLLRHCHWLYNRHRRRLRTITEYDLEEFKPEDIDRLLKLGVISASKVALDEHDGFVEYID